MNETNTGSLLDWLLRKHPDTPKNRAKQWILAGRVSVNGVIIRKPHESLADPGDGLELTAATRPRWPAAPGGRFIRASRCFTWMQPWRWSTKAPV